MEFRALLDEMIRRMGDLRGGIGHLRTLKRK